METIKVARPAEGVMLIRRAAYRRRWTSKRVRDSLAQQQPQGMFDPSKA